jgi:hypothetical protein
LSDSNPGQFFYSVFFTPEDIGNGDGVFDRGETVEISIPYPFETQTENGNPVHAYTGVTVEDHNGETCFVPKLDGTAFPLSYTLGEYTDSNGDGSIGFGDFYTMTVDVSGLDDGFVYLNLPAPSPLLVTEGANTGEQSGVDLSQASLAPAVAAATEFWADRGVDAEGLA